MVISQWSYDKRKFFHPTEHRLHISKPPPTPQPARTSGSPARLFWARRPAVPLGVAHEPTDSATAGALLDWRFPGSLMRTNASPYSV